MLYFRVFAIIISLFVFTNQIVGQEDEYYHKNTLGSGIFLSLENNIIDVTEFDEMLKSNNLLACNYKPSAMGYGFFLQVNHWLASISVNSSDESSKNHISRSKTGYYSFSANLAYDFLSSPRYSLAPVLGYKSSSIFYTFYETFHNTNGFESYLSATLNEKKLSYSRRYINAGITANYYRFIHIGIQTGVLLAPGKGKWLIQEEKNNYDNSPVIKHKFYFSLLLGIAVFNKNYNKSNFSI